MSYYCGYCSDRIKKNFFTQGTEVIILTSSLDFTIGYPVDNTSTSRTRCQNDSGEGVPLKAT